VVTSRNQLAGLAAAEGARHICLDVLTRGEARDLLGLRLGGRRLAAEPEGGDRLVELCARLPLALSIAAARAAAHPAFRLGLLADELQHSGSTLDVLDGGDTASDVRAVFSWSYQKLSEPAARMFRLAGIHPGADVTLAAAASLAALPVRQARRLLGELTGAHLLAELAPGRYGCHDLLRAYAAELASGTDRSADRRAALRRLLDHYLHTAAAADRLLYPARIPITLAAPEPGVTVPELTTHDQALAWLDAEHRGLLAAVGAAADGGFDRHAWQLARALETFFYRRGHLRDWAATQRTSLDAARRLGDRYAEAEAHQGIANTQIELGHPGSAEAHLAQALRLYEETADLGGQARVYVNSSRALEGQSRYRDALTHSRRALRLSRAAGAEAKATEANALSAIGWELAMLGRYQEALGYCQQALALHRQVGNKHGQPPALDTLAYSHQHLGHHGEAAHYYRCAVELYAELGHRYPKAETLTYAGDAHRANGDLRAARDAWQEALAILDDLHHPDADQVRARLHDTQCRPPERLDGSPS
jgi:tetratricopeptide (TPR) repeat protein